MGQEFKSALEKQREDTHGKITEYDDEIYTPEVAAKSSMGMVGLSIWCKSLNDYHKQSKECHKQELRLYEIKIRELDETLTNAKNEILSLEDHQARYKE